MRKFAVAVTAAVLLTAAGAAWAEGEEQKQAPAPEKQRMGEKMRERRGEIVKEMDADADGKVTFEEFKAFNEKHMKDRFDRMDTNKDGVLTKEDRPMHPRGDKPAPAASEEGAKKAAE